MITVPPEIARLEADRDLQQLSLIAETEKIKTRKLAIQNELAALKNTVRTRGRYLPSDEYKRICVKQTDRTKEISQLESQLMEAKSGLRKIEADYQRKKCDVYLKISKETNGSSNLINLLDDLANKYAKFSADHTRVASMRTMAAQFAEEIRKLMALG